MKGHAPLDNRVVGVGGTSTPIVHDVTWGSSFWTNHYPHILPYMYPTYYHCMYTLKSLNSIAGESERVLLKLMNDPFSF